jgi:hypothetical protein
MFLKCKFAVEAMLKTGGEATICLSSVSGEAGQKRQAVLAGGKAMHPIGRLSQPEESDEASFITGAILPMDGGYLAQ